MSEYTMFGQADRKSGHHTIAEIKTEVIPDVGDLVNWVAEDGTPQHAKVLGRQFHYEATGVVVTIRVDRS